jgi:hypothetical protein
MFENKHRFVIALSSLFVVTGILIQFIWNHYQEGRRVDVVIGILSARHNFKKRETIRKTWLKSTRVSPTGLKWVAFFVIGSKDCHEPESDRVSPFSCSRIKITSQDLESSYSSSFKSINNGRKNDCNPVVGLSFQVRINDY